ncbi:hypothetical protein QQP08_005814 [Theobroma cacao]|nr:hypothetical protein QQP08_005814 [Theobroma cacao]
MNLGAKKSLRMPEFGPYPKMYPKLMFVSNVVPGRKQFLHNSNELQTCVRTVIVLYLEIARDALIRYNNKPTTKVNQT